MKIYVLTNPMPYLDKGTIIQDATMEGKGFKISNSDIEMVNGIEWLQFIINEKLHNGYMDLIFDSSVEVEENLLAELSHNPDARSIWDMKE